MKAPEAPRLDARRTSEFRTELLERARSWIPSWDLSEEQQDFGKALLDIAARFSAEVTERLDGAGDKMRRGFLDWLAVRGDAARPSRVPVVLKLTDSAREAVLAEAPVRLQADAGGVPVVFETEKDVRVIPGGIASVVAVDADADAFYLPAPGLSDLQPLEPVPVEWELKTFAAAGVKTLQVTPDTGLVKGMFVDAGGRQYEIEEVNGEIIKITIPLVSDLLPGTLLRKVTVFTPFEAGTYNQQEHALYLGHTDLLNIEAAARIDVVGAAQLGTPVKWQYWGKGADAGDPDEVAWQRLDLNSDEQRSTAVVLRKAAGAVEPREVNGISSRWIRAFTPRVDLPRPALSVDRVELQINYADTPQDCPRPGGASELYAAEAMANTTPLVLDKLFFPLGKEPRQFDAFYLGSQEALSKKDAEVQLCFQVAQASFSALSALRGGPLANLMLAGAAADGYLYLLRFDSVTGALSRFAAREPMRPPSPGPGGGVIDTPAVPLDPGPVYRLPIWSSGSDVLVAASAASAVWIWRENTVDAAQSGWVPAGDVGPVTNASAPIEGLVFLGDGGAGRLYALRESKVFVRNLNDPNPTWEPVQTQDGGGNDVALTRIAPVGVEGVDIGSGSLDEGLVGVDAGGSLYLVTFVTGPTIGDCDELLTGAAPDIAPAAVRSSGAGTRLVAVAAGRAQSPRKLLASLSNPAVNMDVILDGPDIVGGSIDVNLTGNQLTFVTCVRTGESHVLSSWAPLDTLAPDAAFSSRIPAHMGTPAGAPTLLPQYVFVPTSSSKVIGAGFDVLRRLELNEVMRSAVISPATAGALVDGDRVGIPTISVVAPVYKLEMIQGVNGHEHNGETLYEFNHFSVDTELLVYRATTIPFTGTIPDPATPAEMAIDSLDLETDQDLVLLIRTDVSTALYTVAAFDGMSGIATLDPPLAVTNPALPVSYFVPEESPARLRPMLRLDPATKGTWPASVLDRVRLIFPGALPLLQNATAFTTDGSAQPELVALGSHWTNPPAVAASKVKFLVDASLGEWSAQLGDTSTNPELSWEYWNGKGWWGLNANDTTGHLKTTGTVRFNVPADLTASDWAGKTNFWIRARLIGGDYGREKVTVVTTPKPGGGSEQVVVRSTDGIRAPSVLKLDISYRITTGILPSFVLARDSGSFRDQSDANRTAGAIVEAFVPLAVTLGRLRSAGAGTLAPAAAIDCPPECRCSGVRSTEAAGAMVPAALPGTSSAINAPPATGRAVLMGLTAPPSEAPVNVLLLVDRERNYSALAPMAVEALVADRFVPIVADDTTRALGESGVLSMTFAEPPAPREMFGRTLSWLQLRPGTVSDVASAAGITWSPTLRGAYLNAVWASATETLTRELIGSSDGAPRMTFAVARPPLLTSSLELRVREPLGDEERLDLQTRDDHLVLSNVEGLPGDWVLWKRVIDPGDEDPDARVYGLDETTGRITFGDGLHGMIPPIGRDSIVAFSYQRTETGADASGAVPGNMIAPRTPFNLVSPVEGVEAVVAADQAAGGAPPESDDRVLRFGFAKIRHRRRAVTARDVEDLALQSSPDFAQARCLIRRGYARLIVVMRGSNPQPNASQVRELRRLLLDASPVALAAPGALRIEGPATRRLRIDLTLRIPTLDEAGDVGRDVKKRLAQLFNTAEGGTDGHGWPLGQSPTDGDIAYALMDSPSLESVAGVALRESTGRRSDTVWPASFKPNELAVLAEDPVRLNFETAEVTA